MLVGGWVLVLLFMCDTIVGQDVVNTTSGEVRGQWLESRGVIQFLGIPYAEAAVGELRFNPPVRKARMGGIYNATSNAMVCPQPTTTFTPNSTTITEDCLRLDIYVPSSQAVISGNQNFTVMIYIHGGGYQYGASYIFTPYTIASLGQVIVVTLNYRLGMFGFLNTMDDNSVGNFGLRDQCSAIEWVVDNIGEFGGDVSRVTIFGLSAGASSVTQLAMSSLCKGKFHRVIAQSGSPESPWSYNRDPKKSSHNLATNSGCPSDSPGLIKCLRKMTWEELLQIQSTVFSFLGNDWVPTYTGDVFPDDPLDILSGKDSPGLRRFRSLDLLSGVCNEEGELAFNIDIGSVTAFNPTINQDDAIMTDATFQGKLRVLIAYVRGLDTYEMHRLFSVSKFQYTDWKNRNADFSNAKMLIQLYSDLTFNIGSVGYSNVHSTGKSAENQTPARGNTYFYQFKPKGSWVTGYPWTKGATHGDDVFFTFDFAFFVNRTSDEIQLSTQMIEYLTNFAKTGSPNEPTRTMSEPVWPMYDEEKGEFIELDLNLSNDSISAFPYARRIAFWEELFKPQLEQVRADLEKMETKCEEDIGNSGVTLSSSGVLKFLILASIIPAVLSYMS